MRNFSKNKYILNENYCLIELKTYKETFYTKISLEDVESCKKYKWRFYRDKSKIYVKANYYTTQNKRKSITLHRFLLNPPKDMLVDHINGDSLDNRRQNLRIVNHQINALNRKTFRISSSGVKHVYIFNDGHKDYYRALINRFGYPIFCKHLSKCPENLEILQNMIREVLLYLKDPTRKISEEVRLNIQKWENKNKNKNKSKRTLGYNRFCEEIKKLDNYTCCGCNRNFKDKPNELEVHHIITRTENPDLIRDVDNCVSLCKECHYSIKSREKKIQSLLQKVVKYRS